MDQQFEYIATVNDPSAFLNDKLTRSNSRLRTMMFSKQNSAKKSVFRTKSLNKNFSSYFTQQQLPTFNTAL